MSPSIIGKNYVFVSSFIINVVRDLELHLYGALRFKAFAKQQPLHLMVRIACCFSLDLIANSLSCFQVPFYSCLVGCEFKAWKW
jgi:hypothetical protein